MNHDESTRPLIEIALSPVADIVSGLSDDLKEKINSTLEAFLNMRISKEQATSITHSLIKTTQPIDKLDEILQTNDTPIPFLASSIPQPKFAAGRNRTRAWSSYEDQRLLAAIHKYGFNNWALVSTFVGNGRTKAQCSQRWLRGLDPRIEKTPWSSEQDKKLIECVEIYGDKCWTKVAEEIGNRSDVQCRYRYLQLRKEMTGKEDHKSSPPPKRSSDGSPVNQKQAKGQQSHQTPPIFYPVVQGMNIMQVSQFQPQPIGQFKPMPSKAANIPVVFGQPQQFFPMYPQMSVRPTTFVQQLPAGVFGQQQFQTAGMTYQGIAAIPQMGPVHNPMVTGFQTVAALPSIPSGNPPATQKQIKAKDDKKEVSEADMIRFDDIPQITTTDSIFQIHQQNDTPWRE